MSKHKTIGTEKGVKAFQGVDIVTILIYLLMVILGWFTIYAAGYDPDFLGDAMVIDGRPRSQLVWVGISLAFALLILLVEPRVIRNSSPYLYGAMLLLLIATIFLAPDIKGSHSWLVITDTVRIQPAEFAKVTTAMMLSWWCSRYEFDLRKPLDLSVALGIFLLPLAVIILQSETGSALVFLSFFLVMYREGLTGSILLFGALLVVLFVVTLRYQDVVWGNTEASHLLVYLILYVATLVGMKGYSKANRRTIYIGIVLLPALMLLALITNIFAIVDYAIPAFIALVALLVLCLYRGVRQADSKLFLVGIIMGFSIVLQRGVEYFFENILQPHQQTRILVSLGLKDDPSGAGYNVRQSMIAIGSGGVMGKGYLKGTQTKLSFVPEQDTDFIFCTIGEEYGFIGSLVLLGLFACLLIRLIKIAERQDNTYARMYGYSVACIIFFHVIINIGMVIGLVPVIGIPLPFFSYGGSSLLSFTILLFILLRLDSTRRATDD